MAENNDFPVAWGKKTCYNKQVAKRTRVNPSPEHLRKNFMRGEELRRKFFMAVISMKQLLEAGVHFGHQTRRWNPKMAQYIFTERNGIYIIDLQKTVKKCDEAYMFIRNLAMEGKTVLFVGTKKQAQESIEEEAKRCGMYFVNNRWLGGMLTNFRTIRTRIERLNKIDDMEAKGEFDVLPKKEVAQLIREREKLTANLGGIREMKKLPGARGSAEQLPSWGERRIRP